MKRTAFFLAILTILGWSEICQAEDGDGGNNMDVGVDVGNNNQLGLNSNIAPVFTFEGGKPFRQFANTPGLLTSIPSSAFIPPGAPYTYMDGSMYGTFSGWYTREMLENSLEGQKFGDTKVVNYYGLSTEAVPMRILFVFGAEKIPSGLYFVPEGTISVKAKGDGETTSFGLITKAGLEANSLGANIIVFISQGAERELKAKSLSFGLSGSGAGVPGEETAANMVGGTGFGTGTSGYRHPPWVHAYYGKVYTEYEFNQLWSEAAQSEEEEEAQ